MKPSSIAIFIVVIACAVIDISLKNWQKEERVIEHDIHSYYAYLPAYFIYDDIALKKSDYRYGDNQYRFWPAYTAEGEKVIKMTMGTAMLYSPFFFAGHLYAKNSTYEPNGFSEPYKIALLLSALFYLGLGLLVTKKILELFCFSEAVISLTLLVLGLGTGLLCYSSQSAPMSHVYSFFLFAVFIYYSCRWHENTSIKNVLIIGFSFGLISLVRPSNGVIALFFILYNVTDRNSLLQKIKLFKNFWWQLVLIIVCTAIVWVPQIAYWKSVTGDYYYYAYGNETFYWLKPKFLDVLFSYQKGWLVYTPLMLLAIGGVYFLKDELRKFRLGIILFLISNTYIISCWWCWWYGGCLGQRSFIESYALLAIPLAAIIHVILKQKKYVSISAGVVVVFFCWLNIFQTYQFEFKSLHHDGMSRKLYFKQFGKLDKVADFEQHVRWPNYEEALKGNR
ncbi:MAG: hypothetical protein J0M08_00325 [Bacteroidetes bacterium]|nr:hypothetical protein [Bacteroidota bacterium]